MFGFGRKKTEQVIDAAPTINSIVQESSFQEVKIGEICEMRNRGSDYYKQSEFVDPHEGAMILQPPNIENNRLNFEGVSYYSWEGYNRKPELNIQVGDVLLVKMAASGAPFKSAVVYELPEPAITNSSIHIFKNLKCNPTYFQLILSSSELQDQMKSLQTKSTILTIKQSTLLDMTILLPPREVQDIIAERLTEYRSKTEELVNQLNLEADARKKQYNWYADRLLWKK